MKRVVFFVGVSLIAGVLGVKAQNNVKSSDFVRTPDSLLKLWEEQDEKEAKEPVANRIFQVVEERPQFPGGDVALMKYLQDSLFAILLFVWSSSCKVASLCSLW